MKSSDTLDLENPNHFSGSDHNTVYQKGNFVEDLISYLAHWIFDQSNYTCSSFIKHTYEFLSVRSTGDRTLALK